MGEGEHPAPAMGGAGLAFFVPIVILVVVVLDPSVPERPSFPPMGAEHRLHLRNPSADALFIERLPIKGQTSVQSLPFPCLGIVCLSSA